MTLFTALHDARDKAKEADREHERSARQADYRPSDVTDSYGAAALAGERETLLGTAEGGRDDQANISALKLGGKVAGGHIAEGDVRAMLEAVIDEWDYPHGNPFTYQDVERWMRGGFAKGLTDPRTSADLDEGLIEWASLQSPHSQQSEASSTSAHSSDSSLLSTPDSPAPDSPEARYAAAVNRKAFELQLARDAKKQVDALDAVRTFRTPPFLPTLTAELLIPDEPVTYAVDQLMPTGSNVLLTASRKTGKTHLVNHLVKCLADGRPFLDRWDVTRNGRVALFNYEVGRDQYRRWLREVGIENTEQVVTLPLRGYRLPLVVPHIEDWVVEWLKRHEVGFWIVDPFARAFTGSGTSENDNTEVGVFLDTLDVIKERAGVSELVLPTHTGKGTPGEGGERARGATRLEDWADVLWSMTKDECEGERFFSAFGRDVEIAEGRLEYHENARGYSFQHGEDRKANDKKGRLMRLVQIVASNPGINVSALRTQLGGRTDAFTPLRDQAVAEGLVSEAVAGQVKRYYVKDYQGNPVPPEGT